MKCEWLNDRNTLTYFRTIEEQPHSQFGTAIKGNLRKKKRKSKKGEREQPEDENERHFLIGNVTIAMNKWWKLIAIFFIIIFPKKSIPPWSDM